MKITLYENGSAYFEKEVFVLCDEPLEIEVDTDKEYDNLYAVCTSAKDHFPYKVKDGKVIIPPSFMSPGEMHITFKQIANGEVLKWWHSERVTIKGLEDKYEVIPELALLKKAVTELYGLVNKNKNI